MLIKKEKLKVMVLYNIPQTRDEVDRISEAGVENEAMAVFNALKKSGMEAMLFGLSDLTEDFNKIVSAKPDVVFNLCEGYKANARFEMHVAAMLELIGLKYTGNRPLTLGLSQDKVLTKKLLESKKIRTPMYQVFNEVPKHTYLNFPVIAKPSREDASLGITEESVVSNIEDLRSVVSRLLEKYNQPILVEKFIIGREFNVSIIGEHEPRVLGIAEIDFSSIKDKHKQFTSYEAKWFEEHQWYKSTPSVCPAQISPELKRKIEDLSIVVYKLLMGRDYGRVDIRVDGSGRVYVLEFNPNPDISPGAGFSKALKAAKIDYVDFIRQVVLKAKEREVI
ncbi:MAG: hypothetical protein Kow0037_23940 [Calditrichia bacterium]